MNHDQMHETIQTWLSSSTRMKRLTMGNHPMWRNVPFLGADELLLKMGRRYEPKPVPTSIRMGRPKSCYDNALALVLDQPNRFTYVEGLAYSEKILFPIWHAWVLDTDGMIIDNTPTWPNPLDSAYWGLAMPLDVVKEAMLRTGYSGVFEADWRAEFMFVREGWRGCVDSALA